MMKNSGLVFALFLFTALVPVLLNGDTAGVEFLYKCPCCAERFMGYHVRGGNAGPREKEIQFDGSKYDFILPTVSGVEYDSDMCYVFEGANKYAVSILTCPYCGFSFTHTHHRMQVPEPVRQKVLAMLKPEITAFKKEYQSKMIQRGNKTYKVNEYNFQNRIPMDIKFNNALKCYEWLNFSPAYRSRVAVYGAWGYRTEICRPFTIASDAFNKAVNRIDKKINKYSDELQMIEKNEPQRKQKRLREILEEILKSGKTSDMENGILYSMLIGINDRLGRHSDVLKYITLGKKPAGGEDRFMYYVKELEEYAQHENDFLKEALRLKKKGLAEVNYSRTKLLNEIYLIGEFCKRIGNTDGAVYWFSLLRKTEDSPDFMKTHAEVRMKELSDLTALYGNQGGVTPEDNLLGSQIKDGLGTVAYYIRNGHAQKNKNPDVCKTVMKRIGHALLVYKSDKGYYPDTFQELWDESYIASPLLVNFFCCPVTGKSYEYTQPKTGFLIWPLLVDAVAHSWKTEQPFFGVFNSNGFFAREAAKPKELN